MTQSYADPRPEYWSEYSNLQRVKHDLIRDYLNGWFPKLTFGGANRVIYFDTHAGRGKHLQGQLGSPLVALTTLLNHGYRQGLLARGEVRFIFLERDEDNLASLRRELERYQPLPRNVFVETYQGDCFSILEEVVSSFGGGNRLAPSFLFCDPYGFSIPGSVFRKFMRFPQVELFINVIWRELDMAVKQGDKPGMAERLDTVFDGPRWREAIVSSDFDERAQQCATLFGEIAGAKWATPIRMLGDNRRTRYFLLHLSNHDAGRDLMKECMWKVCPEGGYYVLKRDDPKQQFLITREPDLAPLRAWVLGKLSRGPRSWQALIADLRSGDWLPKHLNRVISALRKESVIIAEDYAGRCTPSSNPWLRLPRR